MRILFQYFFLSYMIISSMWLSDGTKAGVHEYAMHRIYSWFFLQRINILHVYWWLIPWTPYIEHSINFVLYLNINDIDECTYSLCKFVDIHKTPNIHPKTQRNRFKQMVLNKMNCLARNEKSHRKSRNWPRHWIYIDITDWYCLVNWLIQNNCNTMNLCCLLYMYEVW